MEIYVTRDNHWVDVSQKPIKDGGKLSEEFRRDWARAIDRYDDARRLTRHERAATHSYVDARGSTGIPVMCIRGTVMIATPPWLKVRDGSARRVRGFAHSMTPKPPARRRWKETESESCHVSHRITTSSERSRCSTSRASNLSGDSERMFRVPNVKCAAKWLSVTCDRNRN